MSDFKSRMVVFGQGLALLTALSIPVMAQINSGSLSGVVTDPHGAIVGGAQVTAVETSTHNTYTDVTNSDGVYTILSLATGTYDLTIARPGFQTLTQQGIPLASGENRKVDAKLVVGQVSETVEVTGIAPALETRDGANSEQIESQTLLQLPNELNGGMRNAANYIADFPGFQSGPGFQNNMNGSIGGYNEVYVDGTPEETNAAGGGITRFLFSTEMVGELKMVTTPMADLGNTGGIAVSYITKSGTNQLHASAYDYIRNTAFDSSCDQFCPGAKPADHQGEYGFTVGGPVYIPRLYDGRNKTFFYFNWGKYYYSYTVPESFYGVPTDAMKLGNFSSFLGPQIGTDASGNPVYTGEIYNPKTTTTVNGQVVRTPFGAGSNVIPSTSFDATSAKYQTIFPEPLVSGTPNGANYFTAGAAGSSPNTYWQLDIDQNIGSKDRLQGSYWRVSTPTYTPLALPPILEVFTGSLDDGHFIHLNWTHTFTSSLVEQASFGFDRGILHANPPAAAQNGAATVGQTNPLGPCTPSLSITGGYMTSQRGDYYCSQTEADNNMEINDGWSWAKGKHLFKWGFNTIHFNANFPQISNLYAGFRSAETSLPDSPTCPNCGSLTGNSYASFLIGAVDDAETQGITETSPRIWQYGWYFQDEFRVARNLTLTYALRYDIQPFPIQAHDATSQFLPTVPNPGCDGCLGSLGFLGHGPGTLNTRNVVPNVFGLRDFGPKFGFAYQVEKNTVIRGAVTLATGPVWQILAGFAEQFAQGYYPHFADTSPDGISPAWQLQNGYPFPPGVPLYHNFNPTVANGSATGFLGNTADRAPLILNTHLTVEHQFPGRVVVGLHYNGSYAHGILTGTGQPLNQLNYGTYASYGEACLTSNITAQVGCPAVVPLPYANYTGTVEQALRPFPQYQDIENQAAPNGTSTYSGGQITAKKDFSNGLSFLVGYTLEKEMSNLNSTPGYFSDAAQNAYNPGAEKAPAAVDMPNQLLLDYTYALPVGKGQRFNINNKALDMVAGGWSSSGILLYESGMPLSISSNTVLFSQPSSSVTSNSVRPNVVPGETVRTSVSCSAFNPAGGNFADADTYLNPSAFVMPGALQFGNAPRAFGNEGRQCPYYNENISFFKNLHLTEQLNLKIGADFFNLFNRHVWSAPDADFQDPGYGKITGLANTPRQIQFNARLSF
jgi:Carboxypeptidase regulatory-like domain